MRFITIAARTFVFGSFLVGCEQLRRKAEPTTCNLNAVGISDSSIGPLYIDEALPALRVRCPSVTDTTIAEFGAAGSVPAMRLTVVGAPIVIRHDGKKVTALAVNSPIFRTNDSLGVGTSVSSFRNVRGIRLSKAGDAPAMLLDRRRCGVTYELSGWGESLPPAPGDPPYSGAVLASWPTSIVVRAVTVKGCRGVTGDLGVDSIAEALMDTAPTLIDSVVTPTSPATVSALPEQPAGTRKADTATSAFPKTATPATIATPKELAELRAALIIPVQGVTRSQLRDTYTESRSAGRLHEAIDILAPRGTPALSATDGRLLKLFSSKAGGLMVYASDPSDRFVLLYAHLDKYADGLREGMPLKRGQVIGYVGTTGNAPKNTPHLHFGILRGHPSAAWWKGTAVNPYPLLVPTKASP